MKTTVELPDELLREAKAAAAREGRSLEDLLAQAVRELLGRSSDARRGAEEWGAVFGKAKRSQVKAIDEVVGRDLERTDLESWR
jgi:metal-responsive CopG/Arc/MetJ family transcriptional regulator